MVFKFGHLRSSSVLSLCAVVMAAAISGLFLSCNNPFRADMGEQVVWERPTISNVLPASNYFLAGVARFQGEAWAQRELRRIEVRISGNNAEEVILDWTDITRLGGDLSLADRDDGVGGNWGFSLDTLAMPQAARRARLEDGVVRVWFRVFDNTPEPAISQEFVFNVKNDPSDVRLSVPDLNHQHWTGRVAAAALIQGRVTDDRGFAPGYPMIQIWPAHRADITANPDAFAGDDRFGFASMFLTVLYPPGSENDDPFGNDGAGTYAQRGQVNVASFQFRLAEFTIGEDPLNPNVRAASFGTEDLAGPHFFRIITRDARGIVGHFPPYDRGAPGEDRSRPGDPVAISVFSDATPPLIVIDNSDIYPDLLAARPNIFVRTGIGERIISLENHVPDRPIFRLRALATHDGDGINTGTAYLRWEHPATPVRHGYFRGELEVQYSTPTAVHFTFTADGNHRDIFTTHPTPYLLTLRVRSLAEVYGEGSFSLIMDGEAPRVEIRPSIHGAIDTPAGGNMSMHGGLVNDSPVTVNCNIQVEVDRTASPPIMFDGGRQMVRWFIGPYFDPAAPDSILARLREFQGEPSRANLGFFLDGPDGPRYHSGWVSEPCDTYRAHNFKFDTRYLTGNQDYWLYVVAMNQVYNLGFAMQRIRVDQETDIPVIEIPGLYRGKTLDNLWVTMAGDDPSNPGLGGNYPRQNVLTGGQGINIRLSDDDGIVLDDRHVFITLSRFLGADQDGDDRWDSETLGTARLGFLEGTSERAWSGTLGQSLMADLFGTGGSLPDGVYRLAIRVRDSDLFKVPIGGERPGSRDSEEKVFLFAVHSTPPAVTVTAPANNSLESRLGVDIYGSVTSPFRLDSLWITFTPDVIGDRGSYDILRESRQGGGRFEVTEPGERVGGLYTYRWYVRNVSFTEGSGGTGADDGRREFTLRAFDTLGFTNAAVPNWVRVDVTAPEIRFTSFNQGRPINAAGEFEVWGNVHFAVNVTDDHGLGSQPLPPGVVAPAFVPGGINPNRLSNVRWWLRPADRPLGASLHWDSPFYIPGVGGTGGQFLAGTNDLSTTFEAVFDSRSLRPGQVYRLYVIARDAAGNEGRLLLDENGSNRIRVRQDADIPEFTRHAPGPDAVTRPDAAGNLRITGLARDLDGFSPDKVGSHVQILFYDNGWDEVDGWIPVPGTMDGTGAIDFAFDVVTGDNRNPAIPGDGDGLIKYRIRISDYDGAVPGRMRRKNPQIAANGNEVHTFLTGTPQKPDTFPGTPRAYHTYGYFPSRDGYFSLVLDRTPPEFTLPEFTPPEPPHLFRDVEGLLGAFPGGSVIEYNLQFFDVTFGGNTYRLLDEQGPNPDWVWDVYAYVVGSVPRRTANVVTALYDWFEGVGQGMQTITFVAQDRAGNRSPSINWDFTKDSQAPAVRFTSFNQGRPLGESGGFEVWGNVHFAVSVTDAHGLGSQPLPDGVSLPSGAVVPDGIDHNRLSNVRWWLLRYDNDFESPEWDTPFPAGVYGTGGRFLCGGNLNATFEAVFDSRALDEDAVYKLYVIARDAAGNEQVQRMDEGGISKIAVNSDADDPIIDRLVPANAGLVLRPDAAGNLRITGRARDTDGFHPARVGANTPANSHVQILFYNNGWDMDDGWLPVSGALDGTTVIDFTFDVVTNNVRNDAIPGSGDGEIRYLIRVSDEPATTVGRIRSKNPQTNEDGDRIHTFISEYAGNQFPNISWADSATFYAAEHRFTLDTTPPVISIEPGIPGRTFNSVGDLLLALPGGAVHDENLDFFDISFGGDTFRLRDSGDWDWNHQLPDGTSIGDALEEWFNDWAADGIHTITFEAGDMAFNRSAPVSWSFTRDRTPPTVAFPSFNQRRPVIAPTNPEQGEEFVFEVWGNVHFEVSVADVHGIGSESRSLQLPTGTVLPGGTAADRLADVKWWLLPYNAPSPTWETYFNGVNQTGGRFLARGDLSATFEAVFDSDSLADGYYKLYVIAMDVAGNSHTQRLNEGGINRIRVNQAADYPVFSGILPADNTFPRVDATGSLFITGLARDTDGFYSATHSDSNVLVTPYVEILFHDGGWDGVWLPVDGALDATGAIDFRFDVMSLGRGDGPILYRLRVSDEPRTTADRTRSRNPQIRDGATVVTFYPFPTIVERGASVSYWPSATGFYSMILDRAAPVIANTIVGNRTMFNYVVDGTTNLRDTLIGGTVTEPNLSFFDVSFGDRTLRLWDESAGTGPHIWGWSSPGRREDGTSTTLLEEFTFWFNGAEDGRHTISFVAQDRAGNRSLPMNWDFIKDTEAPALSFTGFNQGRPINAAGEFEVWGNVHFAVNATDLRGLGSSPLPAGVTLPELQDETLADVRWWLLPYSVAPPTWNTAFPSGPASGTGGQFFAQDGATFQAVFDSRALYEGTLYRLHVIARDVVGNETRRYLGQGDAISRIRVNQDADFPELDMGRLAPSDALVLRPGATGNLRITGLARDTDGFNPPATFPGDVLVSPVEILFYDHSLGGYGWYEEYVDGETRWIPVPGSLDGTGAIDFGFDVVTAFTAYPRALTFNPLIPQAIRDRGDGEIRYRLRVSDEAGTIEGRIRSKNPQIAVGNTFFTGNPASPLPNVPMVDASVRVFPSETGHFSLILDTTPPVIGALPAPPHLFSGVTDLLAVLGSGTVNDANLRFLDVTFGGYTYRLLDNPTGPTHVWDWDTPVEGSDPSNSVEDRLTAWLNGAGDGRHTISFVAEDRAGNRSPSINWDFTRDRTPPTVRFTGFNQGRPVRPYDLDYPEGELVFEVWGNVHFAVNVTDLHGIGSSAIPSGVTMPPGMEDERLAEVRWWLLPYNVAPPTWNTAFPSALVRGMGGQFFAQDGAVFEAVFDSITLEDEEYYRLHIIARDVVGNETRTFLGDGDPISRIRVNQDADLPELDRLAPRNEGGIIAFPRLDAAGTMRITGLARDTDGFNPATLQDSDLLAHDHVYIRFYDDGWADDGWIPVPGRLDGAGAIDFSFDVITAFNPITLVATFNPLIPYAIRSRGDGEILYQIRVRDHAGAVLGRTRNKNPQGDDGVIGRFFTGNPASPVSSAPTVTSATYTTYEGEPNRFTLDTRPPVIGIQDGPRMFRNIGQLVAAIRGTMVEENLSSFTVAFGPGATPLNVAVSSGAWNFEAISGTLGTWFLGAQQGQHTISFVAEDMAGNRSAPTNLTFTKDTEGPTLTLQGGMRRAISHNDQIAGRDIVAGDFPGNWPLDWPLAGGDWVTSWATHLDGAWITAIANWPSDFAFILDDGGEYGRPGSVLRRLEAERDLAPFVFRDRLAGGNLGAIQVRFDDRLSNVWDDEEAVIEYRFTRRGVRDSGPNDGWTRNTVDQNGSPANRLEWGIPLGNFPEGEHSVDIRFNDVAGNITEVQGIRFFVDTVAPFFYMGDIVPAPDSAPADIHRNAPERFRVRLAGMPDSTADLQFGTRHAWVFRANTASVPASDMVFRVRGMVHDANLSQLEVSISGGALVGTITASAYTNASSDPASRLRFTQPALGSDYWLWELDVLATDVAALRGSGNDVEGNISLVATDVANRRTTVHWPFSLDSSAPDINFNLERVIVPGTVAEGQPVPNVPANIEFRGSVEDSTGITGLRFVLAKWNYEDEAWRWFDGDGFYAESHEYEDWEWSDVPRTRGIETLWTAGDTFVSWTVNAAELATAGYTLTAEGQYRIDVWARDGSLAWDGTNTNAGNPTNTVARTNDALDGDIPGDPDGGRFFIDRGAPAIAWPVLPGQTERRFFNTNPGTANLWFDFTVQDPNTVSYFSAVILDVLDNNRVVARTDASGSYANIIEDWFGHRSDQDHDSNEDWYTGLRHVRLRPDGLGTGQYTLVLTVRDAAGNQTNVNHTRTFTIGNEAPRPVVDTPAVTGNLAYSNIALAGPVAIRGRAIAGDGTGGIEDVQFLLLREGQGPTGAPPNPERPTGTEAIAAWNAEWDAWNAQFASLPLTSWRSGAWDYDLGDNGNTRQLMRMEDNPGLSWTISIDNTRNILQSPSAAATYVPVDNTSAITWRGEQIERTGTNPPDTRRMRLAIRSEDAAGNVGFTMRDIWLFPEGDRPWVDIWTPESIVAGENLLSGPFTIRGMAGDNERVQNVFFRVLRDDDPIEMSVPVFRVELPNGSHDEVNYGIEGSPQASRTIDGRAGWFRANSTRTWETDWSALINSYGELEPEERGRGDQITIEVIAVDAARLGGNAVDGEWDTATPMIGRATRGAYVVSGAPFITDEHISLASGIEGPPSLVHMGGGRATFRFTVRHEVGIEDIRYQEVTRVNTAPANQPAQWVLQPTGSEISLFERVNAPDGQPVTQPIVVTETDISARLVSHGFSVRAENERRITEGTPPQLRYVEHDVYVVVNTLYLADLLQQGSGSSFWLPLRISTADISTPSPNEATTVVRLPIDNSPPGARHELNVWPASLATMGGSARAGEAGETGVPGGVDRVVVWFQTIERTGERPSEDYPYDMEPYTIPSEGVSWRRYTPGTPAATPVGFQWADATSSHPLSVTVPDGIGGTRTQNLPHIPARTATTGGNSAIVIDRNNPFGSVTPAVWGNDSPESGVNSVATGWIPGGQGQIWNFTIDTNRLPSGNLELHFVAFDRAGNAFHDMQRVTVMNGAPLIMDIQLATDILGNDNRQTVLGLGGTTRGVFGTDIFSRLRTIFDPAPALEPRERDIRRGIAPSEQSPVAHGSPSAVTGTRHHVDNFTVRNEFLAISVTTPRQHESATRNFRVEYVSGARLFAGTQLRDRLRDRSGGVFVVEEPGGISWQPVGANHATVSAGYAFLASAEIPSDWGNNAVGTVSAWELNDHVGLTATSPLRLQTSVSPETGAVLDGLTREFAYGGNAFGEGGWISTDAAGQSRRTGHWIVDHDPGATHLHERYSLFIIRVYDHAFGDLFTDFTLLSMRVNNNDRTAPFAQLHDLNPMAEHFVAVDGPDAPPPAGIAPAGIGLNRTRGGLWRNDRYGNLSRPGNIEPRYITSSAPLPPGTPNLYTLHRHSLTPAQMGGGNINSAAFFERDTVSGRVVLRGYVEDDQRVYRVDLVFTSGGTESTVTILEPFDPVDGLSDYGTGLLQPARDDVFFYDTIDLFRHRVEWAFVWDTAHYPRTAANVPTVVGDVTVQVIAHNANTAPIPSPEMTWASRAGSMETNTDRYNRNVRNPGFPINVYRYNSIVMNVWPYITGFRRDASSFFNNTRSMQGRYPFSRGETVVVTGFNLGRAGATPLATAITLPGTVAATDVGAVSTAEYTAFNLTSENAARYQRFDIPATAVTGDGIVRLTVGGAAQPAVNTSDNPRTNGTRHVQPWNIERSVAVEGSDLWDNRTAVHIWRSDDNDHFPMRTANWVVFGTSMSINPLTGALVASHNEGGMPGANNIGSTLISSPGGTTREVARFVDPIINSSVFVNSLGEPWSAFSVIGRWSDDSQWSGLGGLMVYGPQGRRWDISNANPANPINQNIYHVESTWYNASLQISSGWPTDQSGVTPTPSLNQFRNPSVVTFRDEAGVEHIHVVYWDSKDNSVKYRYNRRNQAGAAIPFTGGHTNGTVLGAGRIGTANTGGAAANSAIAANYVVRAWTNLDGGYDYDDMEPLAREPSLYRQLAWVRANAVNGGIYVIELSRNDTLFAATADTGAAQLLPTPGAGIYHTVVLRGVGGMRTVWLGNNGTLFRVPPRVTLVLDENITLMGRSAANAAQPPAAENNTNHLVRVLNGGRLIMNEGSRITGNTNTTGTAADGGGGVRVNDGGVFILNGGEISGNNTTSGAGAGNGGGVRVQAGGIFHMISGRIFGNTGQAGGGVYLNAASALFRMGGGTVYGGVAAVAVAMRNVSRAGTSGSLAFTGGGGAARAQNVTFTGMGAGGLLTYTGAGNITAPNNATLTRTPGAFVLPPLTGYVRVSSELTPLDIGPFSRLGENERIVNRTSTSRTSQAGEHNAIAVTSQGHPVIAYFDAANERLRMAISDSTTPYAAAGWVIIPDVTMGDIRGVGAGLYVSIRIDTAATVPAPTDENPSATVANPNQNVVHISTFNPNLNSLVYIRGRVNTSASGAARWAFEMARVVDNVGEVGRRSTISLDSNGNPWIAYFDEGNAGSMDGVKVAFYNPTRFTRAKNDMFGGSLAGWETMHVPAPHRVQDRTGVWSSRLGLENFPTRGNPTASYGGNTGGGWSAAVGFPTTGPFRIAYYVD